MNEEKKIRFTMKVKLEGLEMTPKSIDLHLLNRFNQEVEEFILGSERPQSKNIKVSIEEGPYVLNAIVPLVLAIGLERDIGSVGKQHVLQNVDPKRAAVISKWQHAAKKNSDYSVSIAASDTPLDPIVISHASDYHTPDQNEWVHVEEYVVGTLVDMGGATSPNVHLQLPGRQMLVISTSVQYLKEQQTNYLYRRVQARLSAEKNIKTGAYKNQRLMAIVGEAPSYNESELKAAIAKGTAAWADVPDAVAWVRELRGETRE